MKIKLKDVKYLAKNTERETDELLEWLEETGTMDEDITSEVIEKINSLKSLKIIDILLQNRLNLDTYEIRRRHEYLSDKNYTKSIQELCRQIVEIIENNKIVFDKKEDAIDIQNFRIVTQNCYLDSTYATFILIEAYSLSREITYTKLEEVLRIVKRNHKYEWNPRTQGFEWTELANGEPTTDMDLTDAEFCDHCEEYVTCDTRYSDRYQRTICDRCEESEYWWCESCDSLCQNGDECCDDCSDDEDCECDSCVNRRRERGIQFTTLKKIKEKELFIAGSILKLNRGAGIELEMVRYKDNEKRKELKTRDYFMVTTDGSVGGAGVEIVSNILKGSDMEIPLKDFLDDSDGIKLEVNKTCGYHVHINTSDYGTHNIKDLWQTYFNIEQAMFSVVSPSRRNNKNSYCLTMQEVYKNRYPTNFQKIRELSDMAAEFYKGDDPKHKYNSKRYAWANFHSLFRDNNIEIRLHQGTCNYEKVIHWVALNVAIVEYVKKYGTIIGTTIEEILSILLQKGLIEKSTQAFYLQRKRDLNPQNKTGKENDEIIYPVRPINQMPLTATGVLIDTDTYRMVYRS